MNLAYQSVIEKFENLSEGERSCLLQMLKAPSAQQLTAKGSAHDQFYWALKSLGWAERAPVDDALAAFSAAWILTPEGRRSFPDLLLVKELEQQEEEYGSRLPAESFRIGAKFAAGYVCTQLAAMFAVYFLTRVGLKLAPVLDLAFVALLFASCAAGVYAAVTPWAFRRDPRTRFDDAKTVGALLAMRSHMRLLSIYFAPPVFLFHYVMENVILRFDPAQLANLVGTPALRSMVMTALVCFSCWWIVLPSILDARIKRHLHR